MLTDSRLLDLLACPRCDKTPLATEDDQYYCSACKLGFPFVGSIPWLFADVESSLGEWRNRLHFELQGLAHETQPIDRQLQAEDLPALTRERLSRMKQATDDHRSTLRQILAPIDIQAMTATHETYLALRTRLPSDQGLQTYYANVHRDWSWGDEENAASLEQIRTVAEATPGGTSLGDTLVLGAGACRLAYDIHMQLNAARTIALDFNPLLLLIAKNIMQGNKQTLYEFPIAPITIDDCAVLRELSAAKPVRDNFHLILGDVLRPPFAAHQFDTVVTPWLVDIIAEDFSVFSRRVNTLLKPDGRWINFGSLSFDHADCARRYSREEAVDIVGNSGFAAPFCHEATIPYMCSPASRHGRQEKVFSFAATKTAAANPPARYKALPDWIVTGKEAVPLLPSFQKQAMTTQIFTFVMSMIDGKRSIADMAKLMEQQKLMPRDEAIPAIRNFLTKMYDDSQHQSKF